MSTVVNIPTDDITLAVVLDLKGQDIPVENQNLSTRFWIIQLTDFRRNANIIEYAKSHGPVTFCVVPWRSDDSDSILDRSSSHGTACFYSTSS